MTPIGHFLINIIQIFWCYSVLFNIHGKTNYKRFKTEIPFYNAKLVYEDLGKSLILFQNGSALVKCEFFSLLGLIFSRISIWYIQYSSFYTIFNVFVLLSPSIICLNSFSLVITKSIEYIYEALLIIFLLLRSLLFGLSGFGFAENGGYHK